MLRALSSAISGLRNHQTKLDVIGNNIANVNTVAYKSGNVRFEELFSQLLGGATAPADRGGINPMQVGLGMRTSAINNDFTQGAVVGTGQTTDLAIEGEGFFIVSDGRQYFYTRDGSFTRDSSGELVNANGLKLMGFVDDTGELKAIHIPLGEELVAKATTAIEFGGNLDASEEVNGGYTYETYLYDSLGRRYTVELNFVKSAENEWDYTIEVIDYNDNPVSIGQGASGTLVYDEEGKLDLDNSVIEDLQFDPDGAADISVALDFSGTKQLAGESNVMERRQDGFGSGELVSFSIGRDGVITGIYSNGMSESLGEIALAYFVNPGGLVKGGSNLYQISSNSGEARIGLPGTGGRGLLRSEALEMSNTDLSYELTEMITTSRAFQANTRVISTSDEILMEVINIKR